MIDFRMEIISKLGTRKSLAHKESFAAYQLVGEVTAHQGKDG
jgi:hypothetical protein